MKAIVAMTQNRVIGSGGKIPWHLPEDFRWFRQATMGGAVLLGRKTFESLGKPLGGRLNLVVTRGPGIDIPGVVTISDLAVFAPEDYAPREVWVAGGAEIYAQTLSRCEELYVSLVDGDFKGDTYFPAFEDRFGNAEVILRLPGFEVRKYHRRPV